MAPSPSTRTGIALGLAIAAGAACAAAWVTGASSFYWLAAGLAVAAAAAWWRLPAQQPAAAPASNVGLGDRACAAPSRPAVPLATSQAGGDASDTHPRLGPYRLEREIARGANSTVHLATDTRDGGTVAIKTLSLRPTHEDDPDLDEARERFAREAETARRLRHRDIVAVLDAGETDELAWIAMEHLQGTELASYASPGHLLPVRTVVQIGIRIAEALAHAHAHGIVHRDIKPANVMVDLERGMVKLADFGIARIADASRTRTGMVLGTPSFMAPEQLAGGQVDARSDVYSLGVLLFQLLTGHLPFESASMRELMGRIANEPAPDVRQWRPEIPQELADAVTLALEKRPEFRHPGAAQLAHDLRTIDLMLAAEVDATNPDTANNASCSLAEPRHNSA
jgi:serine/threonine-protein kinase